MGRREEGSEGGEKRRGEGKEEKGWIEEGEWDYGREAGRG